MRNDLTTAQVAAHTARRKAIYETLHPETVNGENQHTRVRQLGEPSSRFTRATVDATGLKERTIQRAAARGAALGEDAGLIEGTSPDKDVKIARSSA